MNLSSTNLIGENAGTRNGWHVRVRAATWGRLRMGIATRKGADTTCPPLSPSVSKSLACSI